MTGEIRYSTNYFLFRMLGAIILVWIVSSLLYGLYIHFHSDTLPQVLTHGILPVLVALGVGYFLVPKVRHRVFFRHLSSQPNRDIHSLGLYFILIVASISLFWPLATSIRYNIGQVTYLNSVDEMPAHERPTFLELGEWYADKMRVMPLNTYERGKFFDRHHIHLKSLFLVPIFSKATAYRTDAKAWLAFKYEKTIPYNEFLQKHGQPHFDQFIGHFKKINVTAFLYFEQYPSGKERQLLTNMARTHSYFRSGYANIYEGHIIDRDLISLRYFVYFLMGFTIVVLPSLWLISKFLLSPLLSNY